MAPLIGALVLLICLSTVGAQPSPGDYVVRALIPDGTLAGVSVYDSAFDTHTTNCTEVRRCRRRVNSHVTVSETSFFQASVVGYPTDWLVAPATAIPNLVCSLAALGPFDEACHARKDGNYIKGDLSGVVSPFIGGCSHYDVSTCDDYPDKNRYTTIDHAWPIYVDDCHTSITTAMGRINEAWRAANNEHELLVQGTRSPTTTHIIVNRTLEHHLSLPVVAALAYSPYSSSMLGFEEVTQLEVRDGSGRCDLHREHMRKRPMWKAPGNRNSSACARHLAGSGCPNLGVAFTRTSPITSEYLAIASSEMVACAVTPAHLYNGITVYEVRDGIICPWGLGKPIVQLTSVDTASGRTDRNVTVYVTHIGIRTWNQSAVVNDTWTTMTGSSATTAAGAPRTLTNLRCNHARICVGEVGIPVTFTATATLVTLASGSLTTHGDIGVRTFTPFSLLPPYANPFSGCGDHDSAGCPAVHNFTTGSVGFYCPPSNLESCDTNGTMEFRLSSGQLVGWTLEGFTPPQVGLCTTSVAHPDVLYCAHEHAIGDRRRRSAGDLLVTELGAIGEYAALIGGVLTDTATTTARSFLDLAETLGVMAQSFGILAESQLEAVEELDVAVGDVAEGLARETALRQASALAQTRTNQRFSAALANVALWACAISGGDDGGSSCPLTYDLGVTAGTAIIGDVIFLPNHSNLTHPAFRYGSTVGRLTSDSRGRQVFLAGLVSGPCFQRGFMDLRCENGTWTVVPGLATPGAIDTVLGASQLIARNNERIILVGDQLNSRAADLLAMAALADEATRNFSRNQVDLLAELLRQEQIEANLALRDRSFSFGSGLGDFFGGVGDVLVAIANAAAEAADSAGSFFGSGITGMLGGLLKIAVIIGLCFVGFKVAMYFLSQRRSEHALPIEAARSHTGVRPVTSDALYAQPSQPVYDVATHMARVYFGRGEKGLYINVTGRTLVLVSGEAAALTHSVTGRITHMPAPTALELSLACAIHDGAHAQRSVLEGEDVVAYSGDQRVSGISGEFPPAVGFKGACAALVQLC